MFKTSFIVSLLNIPSQFKHIDNYVLLGLLYQKNIIYTIVCMFFTFLMMSKHFIKGTHIRILFDAESIEYGIYI